MNETFYTSRLLSTVDSYDYNGKLKCMLYTEINTNVNVGDMVYITNGIFDNEKITEVRKTDRHSKYVNGFKVLYSDGCKIVIDYDYIVGKTNFSYKSYNIETYLQVFKVDKLSEIEYYSSIEIDTYPVRYNKFQYGYTNNFLFIQDYSVIQDIINNSDFMFTRFVNNVLISADSTNIQDFGERFYVYNGSNTFVDVSVYFDANAFNQYFSNEYLALSDTIGFLNNGKIMFNSDITYKGVEYKKANPYKFITTSSGLNIWDIDIEYKQPILSKLNFKRGYFNGNHNDGVFGTYTKQIQWNPINKWNSGYAINTLWDGGVMNSKSTQETQSFYMNEINGVLSESTDFTNNKGFGYNFMEDSIILNGTINNGNFKNCVIDGGITEDVIESYSLNQPISGTLSFDNGKIEMSNVNNLKMDKGEVKNTHVYNSLLNMTAMVNSELNKCVANGQYNSSDSINVIKAKMFTYSKGTYQTTNIDDLSSILRLYITESDYKKLSFGKSFTISKLNKDYLIGSVENSESLLLPFETKFILDKFYNNNLNKNDEPIICSLKNSIDNRYNRNLKIIDGDGTLSNPYVYEQFNNENTNIEYSIDIELGVDYAYSSIDGDNRFYYINEFFNSYRPYDSTTLDYLFTNTLIENGSFGKGIIHDTTIEYGDFINNNNFMKYNVVGTNMGNHNVYSDKFIASISGNNLILGIYNLNANINETIDIGDLVWIPELIYELSDNTQLPLNGRYKVLDVNLLNENITLIPHESNLVSTFTQINTSPLQGVFLGTSNLPISFIGIHTRMHKNNNIKAGLIYGEYLDNCIIENDSFDNTDKVLSPTNTKHIRIINVNLSTNTVKSGLIYKSYITNTTWNDGVAYKCIWKNETPFKKGIFNDGVWLNGIFDGGYFYNSMGSYSTVGWTHQYFNPGLQHESLILANVSRYWHNGVFNGGVFEDSFLYDGVFNGGLYIKSNARAGVFNGGVIGDKSIDYKRTTIGSVTTYGNLTDTFSPKVIINNIIVENALIGGEGLVIWNNGVFNGGVLTSITNSQYNGGVFIDDYNERQYTTSIGGTLQTYTTSYYDVYRYNTQWHNGVFNGGRITGGVVWFDGVFNDGVFEPKPNQNFDNTILDNQYIDINNDIYDNVIVFNWINGTFNGGTFGSTLFDNIDKKYIKPSWKNGVFNGGTFRGKGWVDGVVTGGKFIGLDKNDTLHDLTDTNLPEYVRLSKEGIYWVNGIVSDSNYEVVNNEKVYIKQKMKSDTTQDDNTVYLSNLIWMDGLINHKTSTIFNSLWINGTFKNGRLLNSTFNPKINGNPYNTTQDSTPRYNNSNLCIWENGLLENSTFNVSQWYNGELKNSTINGSVWHYGIFNGGVANNILWADGKWKSGIWNGSSFDKTNNPYAPEYQTSDAKLFMDYISSSPLSQFGTQSNPAVHINNILNSTYTYLNVLPITRRQTVGFFSVSTLLSLDNKTSLDYDGNTEKDWILRAVGLANTPTPSVDGIQALKVNQLSAGQNTKMVTIGFRNKFDILEKTHDGYYLMFETRYDIINKNASNGYTQPLNGIIPLGGEIRLYLDILCLMDSRMALQSITHIGSSSPLFYDETGRPYVIVDGTTKKYRIPLDNNSDDEMYKTINLSARFINGGNSQVNGNTYTTVLTVAQTTSELAVLEPFLSQLQVKYLDSSNKLFNGIPTGLPQLTALGDDYTYNYGNGQFIKGIWEDGTWNSGYRNDENNIILFSDIEFHSKFDEYNHFIYLNSKNVVHQTPMVLNIGDRVSIGNIIGFDINGGRILLDGVYSINSITTLNDDTIQYSIKIVTKDNVKTIARDSSNHNIKITNNIWVNGKVITGRFINSVLNNVETLGDNFNLIFDYINIIDGNLNGGTINTISSSSSFTNRFSNIRVVDRTIDRFSNITTSPIGFTPLPAEVGVSPLVQGVTNSLGYSNKITESNKNYTRTLIQNMTFSDGHTFEIQTVANETSTTPTNDLSFLRFKNIMNLEYPQTDTLINGVAEGSYVNLMGGVEDSKYLISRGRKTDDVLSSISYIYNPKNKSVDEHYLGIKYTTYDNYIPNDGVFDQSIYGSEPISVNIPESLTEANQNYILDGWKLKSNITLDGLNININNSYMGSNIIPTSNTSITLNTEDRLVVTGESFRFTNTNTSKPNIPRRRYTYVDIEFGDDYKLWANAEVTENKPNGLPQITETSGNVISIFKNYGIYLTTSSPLSSELTMSREFTRIILGTTKSIREYYYDSSKMDIRFRFENKIEVSFNKISYYESDMIPFFRYFERDRVNKLYSVPKYERQAKIVNPNLSMSILNII